MGSFCLGFVLAILLFMNITTTWPETTFPYRKGMLACKQQPARCETLWRAYQMEQRAEQLRREALKTQD